MTADEVAQLLGVRAEWVREQSRQGRIPTVALGRYRRYRRRSIEDWIDALERANVEPSSVSGRAAPQRPRPGTGG
jgi:excisionase family DNA binding protein